MTNGQSLPLFFRDPQPVTHASHATARVKNGDVSFAAGSACGPITLGEFAHACRDYPILFAASTAAPVALWGLDRDNLFVTEGKWDSRAYIPAYVRRYPFSTVRLEEDRGFALAVDGGSDRLVHGGDDGVALFDGEAPSDFTKSLMIFCEQFHADALGTEAFSRALMQQDVLVERRADITLPDGSKAGVNGFRIADPQRLAALPDSVVIEWHRRNWLPAIHFHLLSLSRFEDLMARHVRAKAVAEGQTA